VKAKPINSVRGGAMVIAALHPSYGLFTWPDGCPPLLSFWLWGHFLAAEWVNKPLTAVPGVAGLSGLIVCEEERTLCLSDAALLAALFAEIHWILTTAAKAARRLNAG
jgi:hypothetical protein